MPQKHTLIPIPALARLLLTGSKFEILDGIPEGATLVKAGLEQNTGGLYMLFEHPSFPAIVEAVHQTPIKIDVKDLRMMEQAEDAEFEDLPDKPVVDVDDIPSL